MERHFYSEMSYLEYFGIKVRFYPSVHKVKKKKKISNHGIQQLMMPNQLFSHPQIID